MVLDNFRTIELIWDKANKSIIKTIKTASSDTTGRYFSVKVLDGGQEVTLDNAKLQLYWEHPNFNTSGTDDFNTVNNGGLFKMTFSEELLTNIGELTAHLILILSDGKITSDGFIIEVIKGADDGVVVPTKGSGLVKQIDAKIDKGNVTLNDLTQEVKLAMTGGSVPVVGEKAIGTENIKDNAVTIEKTEFIEVSANLFNKNNQSIKMGYFLQGGKEVANSGYYISHPIDVVSGQTWTLRRAERAGGGFFDGSGEYIQSFGAESGVVTPFTFTVPENAKTMVFNGLINSIDIDMAVKGSTYPSNYIPYGVRLKSSVLISEDEKAEIMSAKSDSNFLSGKIVTNNGDSIMAGAGFAGGFAKIIADRNGMTYENIAVGGGTITGDTKYQDGRNRHYVSRTIENMRSDADYAIILAGVNDGALGVTIGEYTDGYEDTYDDTTFCGAIESMCSKLTQRFAGQKIGFIIPHKMSPAQATYIPKLIEGLEKWGVPYLNFYNTMPSLNYITSLKNTYTNNNDGWHPNEAGYRKYYVDKIESWMRTL